MEDVEDTVPLPVVVDRVPTRPIRRPREAVAYAWPETPPTGLRKFNLGTIPASVTPPRTWRRAAWFAVGTATFVVIALGYAAFTFVGNPWRNRPLEALPGQPTQHLLIPELPGTDTTGTTPTTPSRTTRSTSAARTTTPPRQSEAGHRASPQTVLPGQPSPTTKPARPAKPQPSPTSSTPPTRSTIESVALNSTDPDKLGDVTELYYARVVGDPQAAHELTTGSMHDEGPDGIQARYAGVERIEVNEIMIDPNWAFTRSVLTYVRTDGSTVTVRRELTFSQGDDPRITSDTET